MRQFALRLLASAQRAAIADLSTGPAVAPAVCQPSIALLVVGVVQVQALIRPHRLTASTTRLARVGLQILDQRSPDLLVFPAVIAVRVDLAAWHAISLPVAPQRNRNTSPHAGPQHGGNRQAAQQRPGRDWSHDATRQPVPPQAEHQDISDSRSPAPA